MHTTLQSYHDLAVALNLPEIYFKREDLHPYGSHKGRSIPVMIDTYLSQGKTHFAISSSGNAALAAAIYVQEKNREIDHTIVSENTHKIRDQKNFITLDIFVGNHIAHHKLEKLMAHTDTHIRILKKERPLQALTHAIADGATSLRQSTDDTALIGYDSLAQELIGKAGTIFIGTSSGTTAQALAHYFLKKKHPIQVHIVQTSSCHPLSDVFDSYDGPEEVSEADAITDIIARRKVALIPLIQTTGGSGWVATNNDIETAKILVKKHADLDISNNSALSVVGAMHAVYAGYELRGPVVCLICGE
jgi:threonine dehydratase